jgi:hypothetical protein
LRKDLTRRVAAFETTINQNVYEVVDRVSVKNQLDPEEKKLRFQIDAV